MTCENTITTIINQSTQYLFFIYENVLLLLISTKYVHPRNAWGLNNYLIFNNFVSNI